MSNSLKWKVDTPALLREIADCAIPAKNGGVLKIPLNIFQQLLAEVADRAIIINDKELNKLMIRLNLYEGSTTSKDLIEYLEK